MVFEQDSDMISAIFRRLFLQRFRIVRDWRLVRSLL